MTDCLLSKTIRFIGSLCWSGRLRRCSSPSPSMLSGVMCGLERIVLLEKKSERYKHSQHRWYGSLHHGRAFHKKHNGQQRVGSRGIGMPSRVP